MRKLILSLALGFISLGAFAQTTLPVVVPQPIVKHYDPSTSIVKVKSTTNQNTGRVTPRGEGFASTWYSYVSALVDLGSGIENNAFFSAIYPDSSKREVFFNTDSGRTTARLPNWISAGASFDPKSYVWDADTDEKTISFNSKTTYDLDSTRVTYIYERIQNQYRDTAGNAFPVVDTLVVQAYVNSALGNYRFNVNRITGPDTISFIAPAFNKKTREGVGAIVTQRYLLTDKDSAPSSRLLRFGFNKGQVRITPNNECAVTFTFKPGFRGAEGDTLGRVFGQTAVEDTPSNPRNRFRVLTFIDQNQFTPIFRSTDNNGGLIFLRSSLNLVSPSPIVYYTGRIFGAGIETLNPLFPDVDFHVTNINEVVGIKEQRALATNNILGQVYPNPTNDFARVMVNLTQGSQTTFTVYNALGQAQSVVSQGYLSAGATNVGFSTDNLSNGIYFLQLQSGEGSRVVKFSVSR